MDQEGDSDSGPDMSVDSAESDVNTESELSDIELSSDCDISSSSDDNPQTFDYDDEDI